MSLKSGQTALHVRKLVLESAVYSVLVPTSTKRRADHEQHI